MNKEEKLKAKAKKIAETYRKKIAKAHAQIVKKEEKKAKKLAKKSKVTTTETKTTEKKEIKIV